MKETPTLHRILLECGHGDVRLYRNNVGMLQDKRGEWVRYGVCNPGGSDLIGWQTVIITPDMVGTRIAQFVALEVKGAGGRLTKEQVTFLSIVNSCGGIAGEVRSVEDAKKVLTRLYK